MLRILILFTFIFVSGCSPFGGQTLVEGIAEVVKIIVPTKTSVEVVSGGTQTIETNPSVPSQNYKVSLSVGGQFSQSSTLTASGYRVYSSVQRLDE